MNFGPGRENVTKIEYFFKKDNLPDNYNIFIEDNVNNKGIESFRTGVTCFMNFFTQDELNLIEKEVEETEKLALLDIY